MVLPVEILFDKIESCGDAVDTFIFKSFGDQAAAFSRKYGGFLCRGLAIIIFYFIGIAYYKKYEGWTELDAAYFVTVTISTIGYGYIHPTTDPSRIWTCFYAIVGIALFFDVVAFVARSTLIPFQNRVVDAVSPSGSIYARSLKRFLMSIVSIFIAVFIGTLFFALSQSTWTFDMAFYWVMQTMLTIGYGDLGGDVTDSSKKFSIFFIIFVVGIYATALQNIAEAIVESNRFRTRQKIISTSFSDVELPNKAGASDFLTLDRNQYLIDTLIKMGIIDKVNDVDPILKVSGTYENVLRVMLSFAQDFDKAINRRSLSSSNGNSI
jgi:GH24 family phage-related lysozyme (muramidase)